MENETAVNMNEQRLRKAINQAVAICKKEAINIDELIAQVEVEWDRQNASFSEEKSDQEIEFQKKAETFFESYESEGYLRKNELKVVCAGYELYNKGEGINQKTLAKKIGRSYRVTNSIINNIEAVILQYRYEVIDEKVHNDYINLVNNYLYKKSRTSYLIIRVIAILKNYNY